MTTKTLGTVAVVAVVLSGPVFAQDQTAPKKPIQALQHHRSVYNQVQGPSFIVPGAAATNGSYLDNESFDRARIGDHDPDFNPSGS